MFQLKFAQMYDNAIFHKYNIQPVVEDYFAVKDNIFCVADGVTRDSIHGQAIPYPKDKQEVEEWIKVYPNPSGAYEAAKICADCFIEQVSKYTKEEIDEDIMLKIIKEVNREIAKINEGREIDFLTNDLFGCVAVGGCIVDNMLYCFSIGDCHITVLDGKFNTKFTTINNHEQFEKYLDTVYCKTHSYDWNNAKDRIMVRKEYRNKPEIKYKGEEVSFGVLTGEKEAEHYIDVYQVNLNDAKYICAYSDGCEPFFSTKENIQRLLTNLSEFKNEGKERTLIIYEK